MRRLLGGVFLLFGAIFAAAFIDRYWQWRDCFNELGRCYDPVSQQVYVEQAGVAWGTLTALSLLIGARLIWRR